MNQKFQKCHQHIFCKHSVKLNYGAFWKQLFLEMTQKNIGKGNVEPKGNPIETPLIWVSYSHS